MIDEQGSKPFVPGVFKEETGLKLAGLRAGEAKRERLTGNTFKAWDKLHESIDAILVHLEKLDDRLRALEMRHDRKGPMR